jgi:hypothetical protein
MNKALKIGLIVLAVLVVSGGLFYGGMLVGRTWGVYDLARRTSVNTPGQNNPGFGPRNGYGMGPGMMNRNGRQGFGHDYGFGRMGPGQRNGQGYGPGNGGRMGPGGMWQNGQNGQGYGPGNGGPMGPGWMWNRNGGNPGNPGTAPVNPGNPGPTPTPATS